MFQFAISPYFHVEIATEFLKNTVRADSALQYWLISAGIQNKISKRC